MLLLLISAGLLFVVNALALGILLGAIIKFSEVQIK